MKHGAWCDIGHGSRRCHGRGIMLASDLSARPWSLKRPFARAPAPVMGAAAMTEMAGQAMTRTGVPCFANPGESATPVYAIQ